MMRIPKYVHGFLDRHGKPRFYFRRAGFKQVPLPGLPWSPEFMAAYETASAGQSAPIGVARVIPGSMHALAISYYASPEYLAMRSSSQRVRRNIIEKFCREVDASGRPDTGIRPIAAESRKGFHSWEEVEIAQFETKYPVGSKPRLALALGLFTGQARQDVIAMGPQHIRDEVLTWTRRKTAHSTALELFIPVSPALREILDATPSRHLTFLTTAFGKPFTPAGFGNWFREQCNAAGLPHCTFHGLRKAAARRQAEYGCTPHEIAAITGHATLKEVERYTRAVSRRRLAESAMAKVKLRTVSG